MNKIKIALGAIVVGLVMVSCGADAKIDKLEKACKDKDYEQMEEIANELEKQMNEAKEKLTAAGNGDSEQVKTLKESIKTLETEKAELDKKVKELESKKPVSREEIESEVRAELEAEYEVKTYKAEKMAELKDDILVPELVMGSTKEEIDASIQIALDRSKEILEKVGGTKRQKRTPKNPTNPDVSKVQDSQYSYDYLASLDPASKEYAEVRQQLGLR